jgi:NitT/TauT family transport system substrate-binding protein
MIRSVPLAALLVSIALASCKGERAAPAAPVRVAYLQNDLHHLPLWVAIDAGLFTEEGLAVEVAGVFRSGAELVSAFQAGDLDVAYVGQAPVTIGVARGNVKLEVLALVNAEGSEVVVRADDASVASVGDLRAKTVAIPALGSVQDLLLRKALHAAGVGDAPNVVVLRPPEMEGALRDGQIDAFIAWEPFASRARTNGIGRTLEPSRRIWPGHPCCVLAAERGFVDRRRGAAEAFTRAHRRAVERVRARPEEAVAVAVKYTGMDAAIIREAMKGVVYRHALSRPDQEEVVRSLAALDYIPATDPARFVDGLIAPPPGERGAR